MISNNLFLKNNIYSKNLKNVSIKSLSKKFDKIFLEISKDLKDSKKTLNVLNNKLKLNLNINKFQKYKKIAIIGMGGSILGSEAIYNFFKNKIKKKVYFLNDIDENKISDLKKKENLSKVLFIIISKSGNTIETLSNTFSLNILKKNSKNIIIISEKKIIYYFLYQKNLIYFLLNTITTLEEDIQSFQKLVWFQLI